MHVLNCCTQWRIQDFPLGGGGANLRHIHFLAKMYAKMKEIDPVGGGGRRGAPLDPPMVLDSFCSKIYIISDLLQFNLKHVHCTLTNHLFHTKICVFLHFWA